LAAAVVEGLANAVSVAADAGRKEVVEEDGDEVVLAELSERVIDAVDLQEDLPLVGTQEEGEGQDREHTRDGHPAYCRQTAPRGRPVDPCDDDAAKRCRDCNFCDE